MMKSPKLSEPKTVLSLLISTLFLSALTTTGCAFTPYPAPPWATEKVDVWGGRVFLGGLNATLTQTVHPTDKTVKFVFLSKGAWSESFEWPFNQATRWRFNLYARDGKHLCGSEKFEDWVGSNPWWMPWSKASVEKKACPNPDSTDALPDDYLLPPLRGTLEFRFKENDREDEIVPEMTVDTSYYIVSDSIPCKEIDPDTLKCIWSNKR